MKRFLNLTLSACVAASIAGCYFDDKNDDSSAQAAAPSPMGEEIVKFMSVFPDFDDGGAIAKYGQLQTRIPVSSAEALAYNTSIAVLGNWTYNSKDDLWRMAAFGDYYDIEISFPNNTYLELGTFLWTRGRSVTFADMDALYPPIEANISYVHLTTFYEPTDLSLQFEAYQNALLGNATFEKSDCHGDNVTWFECERNDGTEYRLWAASGDPYPNIQWRRKIL